MPHATMTEQTREVLGRTEACAEACRETLSHCLEMGGPHAAAGHVRGLIDCAELCDLEAAMLVTGSPLAEPVGEVLIEACQHCATSCARIDPDDEQMRLCVEACNACADGIRSAGTATTRAA